MFASRLSGLRMLAKKSGDLTTASSRQGPSFRPSAGPVISLIVRGTFFCDQLIGSVRCHLQMKNDASLRRNGDLAFRSAFGGEPQSQDL